MKTWTSLCFLVLLSLHLGSCTSPTKCSLDESFDHLVTDVVSKHNCEDHLGHAPTPDKQHGAAEEKRNWPPGIGQITRCRERDCADIALSGHYGNGVYKVWPRGWDDCGMDVYCDLENDGGGWTVIQRRGQYGNAKDMFFKNWYQYKTGFGSLYKEFWLGNDKIHHLVKQDEYELNIDLKTRDGEKKYAHYDEFYIAGPHDKFKLSVSKYRGDAGDSLLAHNGMNFATFDKDHGTCAHLYKGAWWYIGCHYSNLNGLNYDGHHATVADGINWYTFKGYHYSMTSTVMKVRPASYGVRMAERGHAFAPTPPTPEEPTPSLGPPAGPDYHEEDSHKDDQHHEEQHL